MEEVVFGYVLSYLFLQTSLLIYHDRLYSDWLYIHILKKILHF